MLRRYIFSFLLILFSSQIILAQPTLTFKRIEVNYPQVKLIFRVDCQNNFRNNIDPQHLLVHENGMLVKDAVLWCPPDTDCCISAVLVFDRSSSMQLNNKMSNVIIGGNKFIDMMNPNGVECDEAGIVSFRETVTVDLPITTDKILLRNAVNGLFAYGNTAVWDATGTGIQQLIAGAHNRCKAVIVLTDGGDNSSKQFSVQSVIQLAVANGVKVFTIGYGITPGSAQDYFLNSIADGTGGKYYLMQDGADVSQVYTDIKEVIKDEYRECYLTYNIQCPDGKKRVVDLTIKDYCGGSDTKTLQYIAPYDPTKFQKVTLELGTGKTIGNQEVIIPVFLRTPVTGIFSKCQFTISYDRNVCDLTGVTTQGGLLDSIPVTFMDIGYGQTIFINGSKWIDGNGIICYLHFAAADVDVLSKTTVYLTSWLFDGYCLLPDPEPGEVTVEPRLPKLDCSVEVPSMISWNDNVKDYQPNPFTAKVIVHNTGLREARNAVAMISISSPFVILQSPTKSTQVMSPSWIIPNEQSEAQWDLLALKNEQRDSVRICFTIITDNHAPLVCCKTVIITPTQTSALMCSLSSCDTIYFREQYYEPDKFSVHVNAINIGTGQTKDVYAQLLQDTRFTIIPPAHVLLDSILHAGDTTRTTFNLAVHPRQTDGYDTVRVNVQGNDTDPLWCYHPIWVQRERSPKFTLTCTTPNNTLIFDEKSGDYIPNPFTVTTLAKNIGETYAEECQIMFVGPPRFTPIGTNLRDVGTMQVNDTRTEQWLIRALPRTIAGWDTLVFQVLGKGGLGKKIVVAECRLPIYVPEIRKPKYQVQCSSPDSILFYQNSYIPDPFEFKLQIANTGDASGWNLNPTMILPQSILLAQGELVSQPIQELKPGETKILTWKLTAQYRNADEIVRLCARVIDPSGTNEECCHDVFIQKVQKPDIRFSCTSIDTLHLDAQTGLYLGNPFQVTFTINNQGKGLAENVRATIMLLGSFVQVVDSLDKFVGNLAAGEIRTIKWLVKAFDRPTSSLVQINLKAYGDNIGNSNCDLFVFIPAYTKPVLQATCSSIPSDTLHFDWTVGDFVPSEFKLNLQVNNIGAFDARNVSAFLVVPEGVMLTDGESSIKSLTPSILAQNEIGNASWKLKPVRQNTGVDRTFTFYVRSSNADEVRCDDNLFIQGAPKSVTISLPKDVLLGFGSKTFLPVTIDKTIGKDLSKYSFQFVYNPKHISILAVTNSNSLTAANWVGAKMKMISDGVIEITDYTTGIPLHADVGTLVNIQVEGIYKKEQNLLEYAESFLHIDQSTALLNDGDIQTYTADGNIIVTTECIHPLIATNVTLSQNRPNPFNPVTIITYSVPKDDFVRLTVMDKMGREVAELVHSNVPAGEHSVLFNGADHASGVYFYRLQTSKHVLLKKMILAK